MLFLSQAVDGKYKDKRPQMVDLKAFDLKPALTDKISKQIQFS